MTGPRVFPVEVTEMAMAPPEDVDPCEWPYPEGPEEWCWVATCCTWRREHYRTEIHAYFALASHLREAHGIETTWGQLMGDANRERAEAS